MYLSARRLFTGRTNELLEDRVLEIEDGRIAWTDGCRLAGTPRTQVIAP